LKRKKLQIFLPKILYYRKKNTVLNVTVPREHWDQIQFVRSLNCSDLRCGPHITFGDPFVASKYLESAANELTEELSGFKPFQLSLEDFAYFIHSKKSVTVYLVSKADPPDALTKLMNHVLKRFPQCTHNIRNGLFTPHISIGKFNSVEEADQIIQDLKKIWKPVTFLLKEMQIIERISIDPFEIKFTVPLGIPTAPYFGFGSIKGDGSVLERSVVMAGLPRYLTNEDFYNNVVKKSGLEPSKYELMLNPDLKTRGLAVLEFDTVSAAAEAIKTYSFQPFPNNNVYLRPLYCMMYPNIIGSNTSVHVALKNFQNKKEQLKSELKR